MTFSAGRQGTDQIYRALRGDILQAVAPPGAAMSEARMAVQFGVSRTPVREALRRLAADGLVRHERHRGVQVQTWSVDDVEEIFEIRGMLEPYGARRAATSGLLDVDALSALADAMQRAAEEHELDAVTALNNRFHAAIVDAAGRARLGPLLASLVHVPLVHNTFARYTAESLQRSLDQHREVVAALRAGDPDWAESAMRAHIRHGWVSIRDRLPADPTPDA